MTNTVGWEPAEPGVRRKILTPGDKLMMMVVEFESGAQGYEHAHPHEQMTYCLKGKFRFVIAGQTIEISEGENLVIPSGALHKTTALEDGMLLDCFTPLREDLLKIK